MLSAKSPTELSINHASQEEYLRAITWFIQRKKYANNYT